MYWIIYSMLLFPLCFISKRNEVKKCYLFFSTILILCLSFRFGIGVDYFNYFNIFQTYSPYSTFRIPMEPIFGLLCYLFNLMHIPFPMFIFSVSIISAVPIIRTIYYYSERPLVTLFIFFTMYYSVYLESAIRAGCALSIFIYSYFRYLRNGEVNKYYLLSFIGIGFHISAAVFLCVPILKKINYRYFRSPGVFFILMMVCFASSFILKYLVSFVINALIPKYTYYIEKEIFSRSYITILFCFFRSFLLFSMIKKRKLDSYEILDLKIYLSGILIYLLLSSFSIASRFTDYFLVLEIFIIPHYLKRNISGKLLLMMMLFFFQFMLLKDLKSFLTYGDYFQNKLINYEYVSVFNKDKIKSQRNITQYSDLDILFK